MPRTKIGDPRTLLGELERWVIIETPTSDAARVNALMDFAVGGLAEAGVALTRSRAATATATTRSLASTSVRG